MPVPGNGPGVFSGRSLLEREPRLPHPFLRRNLPEKALDPDVELAGEDSLEDSLVQNELDCKLVCSTWKALPRFAATPFHLFFVSMFFYFLK
jgi:hypothetical protein